MKRAPKLRAARLTACLIAATTALLLTAACRDLVTDDVVDAESSLCERLQACDLRGCGELQSFFGSGLERQVDGFLRRFAAFDCDRGCGVAPLCLDSAGLCVRSAELCTEDYLCCGASGGEARCQQQLEQDGSATGRCCKGVGVLCEFDDECCFLEGESTGRIGCLQVETVEGSPRVKTCGGVPRCVSLGDACVEDAECCSRSCDGGECVPIQCVPSGGVCEAGVDACCSAADECDRGICQPPETCADGECCLPLRAECDPSVGAGCCDAACISTPFGESFCGTPSCLPPGADCATDAQCTCDGAIQGVACVGDPSIGGAARFCRNVLCGQEVGADCDDTKPCCAGLSCSCKGPDCEGSCEQACEPASCNHGPLSFGPPLPDSLDERPDDAACTDGLRTCAAAVCDLDPYCCCFLWDEICVASAVDLCPPPP